MNYEKATVLIENRADPHIFKHSDGYYYFTASFPEYNKIILRRSTTILGLAAAEEVTVWNCHTNGDMSKYIWAPEIHNINDTWYIYFAAKGEASLDHFSNDAHKIYVIAM